MRAPFSEDLRDAIFEAIFGSQEIPRWLIFPFIFCLIRKILNSFTYTCVNRLIIFYEAWSRIHLNFNSVEINYLKIDL